MRFNTVFIPVALLFAFAFSGHSARAIDCNANGTDDAIEIAADPNRDCNGDGTLDACQTLPPSFKALDVPLLIPDNNTNTGISSFINVSPGVLIVSDVNVQLSIRHTFNGDVDILLVHNLITITLSDDNGSTGDNYLQTFFDDSALLSITTVGSTGPITGTFRPETPLSLFNGTTTSGQWRLRVFDDLGSDTGTLLSWTLFLAAPGSLPDCNSNGSSDICELAGHDCNANLVLDECEIAAGAADCNTNGLLDSCEPGMDCNTNGTLDVCDARTNGTSQQLAAVAPVAPIPDNQPAGPGTLSVITIIANGPLTDVDVRLSIAHTADADLDILLVHGSTTVTLSDDNGGTGDNYSGTLFDDQAATAITAGSAPFTGTFRPETLLSQFNTQNKNGAWTLNVRDDSPTETGTLLNWSLALQTSTPRDCNTNGTLDECDIAMGGFFDANNDRILDICQDCNTNNIPDPIEPGADCNTNGILDSCDIAAGAADCDTNGVPDRCGLVDCNTNLVLDRCELTFDCDLNNVPDVCQLNGSIATTVASPNVPRNIADNSPTGSTSAATVAATGPISDVNVGIIVQHTFQGDLSVRISHVNDGLTALLMNRPGQPQSQFGFASPNLGNPSTLTQFVFDDSAPLVYDTPQTPVANPTGPWKPDTTPLSVFNGSSMTGNWVLTVADNAGGDTGTLLAWTLFLQSPVNNDCNTNGTPDQCDTGDCNTNGTLDACDHTDFNSNGIPDECEPPVCSNAGDMNGDSFVDGNDCQRFLDCLLAGSSSGLCLCSDMTGDGVTDMADVQPFVLKLLGHSELYSMPFSFPALITTDAGPQSTSLDGQLKLMIAPPSAPGIHAVTVAEFTFGTGSVPTVSSETGGMSFLLRTGSGVGFWDEHTGQLSLTFVHDVSSWLLDQTFPPIGPTAIVLPRDDRYHGPLEVWVGSFEGTAHTGPGERLDVAGQTSSQPEGVPKTPATSLDSTTTTSVPKKKYTLECKTEVCNKRKICVQPVFIRDNSSDGSPTGSALADYKQACIDVWAKCCVEVEFKAAITIDVASGKAVNDINTHGGAGTTDESSPQVESLFKQSDEKGKNDCVEVFFVATMSNANGNAHEWGDGVCYGDGKQCKICVADGAGCTPRNNTVLAHELGHAMGLPHPIPGNGTCMDPTGNPPNCPTVGPQKVKQGQCRDLKTPLLIENDPKEECCKTYDP